MEMYHGLGETCCFVWVNYHLLAFSICMAVFCLSNNHSSSSSVSNGEYTNFRAQFVDIMVTVGMLKPYGTIARWKSFAWSPLHEPRHIRYATVSETSSTTHTRPLQTVLYHCDASTSQSWKEDFCSHVLRRPPETKHQKSHGEDREPRVHGNSRESHKKMIADENRDNNNGDFDANSGNNLASQAGQNSPCSVWNLFLLITKASYQRKYSSKVCH